MPTQPQVPNIKIDGHVSNSDDTSERTSISLSRPSIESTVSRYTSNSTIFTGQHRNQFSLNSKSGSHDYSPLGNNSIYEIVMNTRRKDWLRSPTSVDIPPVTVSKLDIIDGWNKIVDDYMEDIGEEETIFQSRNNITNMNKLEQIKQLDDQSSDTYHDDSIVINQIPEFYFEKVFQLDNERTFNKVIESVDLKPQDLVTNDKNKRDEFHLLLKDKLSNYLDGVETLLVSNISRSSHKFFNTLNDVESIQNNIESTINELQLLEKTLQISLDAEIKEKIKNIKLIIKRNNIEKLEQGLLQVKLVVDKTEECKHKFSNDNLEQCMSLIQSINLLIRGDSSSDENVQNWTKDWPFPLIDLKSVLGLIEIRELLTNMKIEVGGKYSLQLSELLLEDLRSAYKNIDTITVINDIQQGKIENVRFKFPTDFETSVREIITKLNECEELTSAFALYEDKITTEVKNIIKYYLPKENISKSDSSLLVVDRSQSVTPKGTGSMNTSTRPPTTRSKLSTLIKEQTPVEFQDMLESIFIHCLCAIKRLYQQQKLLLDISLKVINTSTISENQHNMINQLDIRTNVNEIIRIVQLRMGKVITVRKELTSTLRHDHFLRLYSVCILFIQECEALSGEFLTKYFSDVLSSQIKHYITTHDSRNLRSIQKKIELENWVPAIVSPSIQTDVNDIVSSIDIDPINWTSQLILYQKNDKEEAQNSESDSREINKSTGNRKSVVVGDKTFVASESLLQVIQLIRELLILSTNLPSSYLPYFERMCFNLLKYFNSYTLASITSYQDQTMSAQGKNLSIMGESIDCLREFIVIVQQFFSRQGNNSKDFVPFDSKHYNQLIRQYDSASEKIYLAHAPPPPPV
ncbi:Vps54p PWA37_003754 [Arxiozyma heterogenica]|uniref:Vps54p n=1 Tax=Arxiozyma heterogenica TaxID=278026 RepID=UPI002EEB7745